ncbi:MAG: chorismate-binding protein, partial [Planctomycetes bacterium]|nr:chorismate-binding protein [Planctomycetota bacterium]
FDAPDESINYYNKLQKNFPCYYGTLLPCGPFTILSNSPEEFLYKKDRFIRTRPIKGTIKRGATKKTDNSNKVKLWRSLKDDAELSMIIDLERNDLHKICEINSVKVSCHKRMETHPTVHHLSGEINGRLLPNIEFYDIFTSCFPGGSVTGTPKIAAMNMIEKLEPTKRGVYTGAIGYIKSNGDFCFNVAIRTAIHIRGKMLFNSGGAIVHDSIPELEFNEIITKAHALTNML